MTDDVPTDFPDAPPTTPEDLIGPGKRYANLSELCADLWRWHDEAQAEKMRSMKLEYENAELRRTGVESVATKMDISDVFDDMPRNIRDKWVAVQPFDKVTPGALEAWRALQRLFVQRALATNNAELWKADSLAIGLIVALLKRDVL